MSIKDPEAKKLAEYIIAAQEREIKQMNEIIIRLRKQKNNKVKLYIKIWFVVVVKWP
jgi:hypothetical protein